MMARRQPDLPFGPIRNSLLFSSHWIEDRLPSEPEWDELRAQATTLLDELANLWRVQRGRVEDYGEHALEEAFIQPVLRALGWRLFYQPHLRRRRPDYALFAEEESLDAALRAGRTRMRFWDYPTLVGDSKAWNVSLDRPTYTNDARVYPPKQLEGYLDQSRVDYGVLTNGRQWRLFPRQLAPHQPRFETYLEIDLHSLLDEWTGARNGRQRTFDRQERLIDSFLVFFLFFGPTGYHPIDGRRPLVDRAIEGSTEYRLGIGEGLKERVFGALRFAIQGFILHPENDLDPETDLALCKEQSFILLYRLLFVMFAEDRGLLPYRTNQTYGRNRSLSRLRDHVAGRLDAGPRYGEEAFSTDATGIWEDLTDLFDLVDQGGRRYGVPPYNGGLFDRDENAFLAEKSLPDWYLARVVDGLGRSPDVETGDSDLFRVDYRDLSIQHLGYVYEGLLELDPHFATETMVVVRRRGRQGYEEKIIPENDPVPRGHELSSVRYEPGQVYLVTDKGERRSTGSYYTPDHIVNHIVEAVLLPLCQDVNERLAREVRATRQRYARSRGRPRQLLGDEVAALESDFDDRMLRLRVLDPAMGSGHFLLRACQYLAEEIATNPNTGDPIADELRGDESILAYWKRQVAEHCLYGVDINPLAVELAKLALWLETASLDHPLTFLDHHLRIGNSLVGGWVESLGTHPQLDPLPIFENRVAARLPVLLGPLREISHTPSQTVDQVKDKVRIYREAFDTVRQPFLAVADLWCATYFLTDDRQITPVQYEAALDTLADAVAHTDLLEEEWFKASVAAARSRMSGYFHWELQFPEPFFDLSGRRDDGGFDGVLGNPPYDVLERERLGPSSPHAHLAEYVRASAQYAGALGGKLNLFRLFVVQSLRLVRPGGYCSMIVPLGLLGDKTCGGTRRELLEQCDTVDFWAFPQKDDPNRRVFRTAKQATVIFAGHKTADQHAVSGSLRVRIYPGNTFRDEPLEGHIDAADLEMVNPVSLPIPIVADREWRICVGLHASPRTVRLGEMDDYQATRGEINQRTYRAFITGNEEHMRLLKGVEVGRYCLNQVLSQGQREWFDEARFLESNSQRESAFRRRVATQRITGVNERNRIVATIIDPPVYFADSTNSICVRDGSPYSLEYLLGLLNSRLFQWRFKVSSTNNNVATNELEALPIRVIDFSDTDEQAPYQSIVEAVEEMLQLNQELLDAHEPEQGQRISGRIAEVDRRIDEAVCALYSLGQDEVALILGP